MSLPNTIAVDGPAGSGKSTVSFAVAQRINYLFADTGAFYRAITFLALREQLNFNNPAQIVTLSQRVQLDMTPDLADDDRQYTLLADKQDITHAIHTPEVDAYVSVVAAMSGVRDALMGVQRAIAARGRIIMVGRDIGTVVLPDAELKIYIDASLEKRAERRYQQRIAGGKPMDINHIKAGLEHRDSLDSGRDVAPLLCAPEAVYLDTSSMTLQEAIDAMHKIIMERHFP